MPTIQNKKVTRVSSKKGENKEGKPYVKMGIQLGTDSWYNYFVNKACPAVKKDDMIAFLEYEEDEQWGLQVKLLRLTDDRVVPNDHAPTHGSGVGAKHTPATQEIGKEAGIFASYHKDYAITLMRGVPYGEVPEQMDNIIQLANEFLDASLAAGRRVIQAPKAEPNTDTVKVPEIDTDEPPGFMDGPDTTDDDDIPF